jgi:hypothetical protein
MGRCLTFAALALLGGGGFVQVNPAQGFHSSSSSLNVAGGRRVGPSFLPARLSGDVWTQKRPSCLRHAQPRRSRLEMVDGGLAQLGQDSRKFCHMLQALAVV